MDLTSYLAFEGDISQFHEVIHLLLIFHGWTLANFIAVLAFNEL